MGRCSNQGRLLLLSCTANRIPRSRRQEEGRGKDLLAFAVRLLEVSEVGGQELLGDREGGVRIEPPAPLVQTLAQRRRVDLEVEQSPPAPDVLVSRV